MTPVPQKETSIGQEIPTMPEGDRIVIAGMSGLYPQCHNVKELSDILYNKINPVNAEQLRYKFIHPEAVQQGGSVPELDYFDAQFFKVHYRLGCTMDSMSRKILEQSYQAIYDAGVNPQHLYGKKVGVYIGTCFSETEKGVVYEIAGRQGFGIAGCSKTMFANRVSYWLNAKGPSMSIDEACCSSTAALEQAYQAMSRGECEAAIVGGAYICLHPQSSVHYSRLMKLCNDGKTKSFDENADGCAKSEAINVLFLQKAKDAMRIYADVVYAKTEFTCILDGETGPRFGFYRDVNKTISFVKDFYKEAKIPAQAIEYVEALGCAIPEADKVELQTIEKVFCDQRDTPLLVGSVMSNIGYSEAASGISAITKVLLGYHTGQIAANLHLSKPRQDVIALKDGRMRIVTDHQTFDRTYTAVNGMSVTGLNSHVLLHGHYKAKDLSRYKCSIPYLVTITARHEAAVQHVIDDLKSQPIDPEQLRLLNNIHQVNIAGHLGRGYVILQTDGEEKTVNLSEKVEYFDDARRPLWFVYSGMGSQWTGMGSQLMRIPIFAAAIEKCRRVLEPKGIDIVDIITSTDEKTFDNILHSFAGIAAIQIGLTDILHELGLIPDGIIGHSVGELGCAYADGCLTAEEMILSACSRGFVSLETPFIHGSMAAIGLGYEQIVGMCPPEIEVACHNGPESSTLSGPADAMHEFVAELTAKGIFAKEVPCSNIAYHSRYIANAGPQLLKYLSEVIKSPKPRSERWLSSSVPQEKWDSPAAKLCSAEYHTNNLLNPVLFEETLKLVPKNAVLVEVAPHGLLQAILKRSLPASCKNIALTRRKHPDNAFLLLESIGKLFMEGYNIKLHVLYPKVDLPVSTGTPFLSHLVKWAHGEKWMLPIYSAATRLSSASCEYIISIHDLENSYLQGHSLRGRTLYPFAALLVLVWDTLSMVLGVPKKHMSVQFSDLHLYVQPILHDRRQLKLNVALQRGTGSFEILSQNTRVASGCIKNVSKKYNLITSINEEVNNKIIMDLTAEDIYNVLQDRDYSYSGEFQSLVGAGESFSIALLEWRNNWVTFIDGLIQLHMLRQPHTAVSLPTNIRSLTINVPVHENSISQSAVSDNKVILKAELLDKSTITRCGGVTIDNVKLENVPPRDVGFMSLKTLKFVPNLQSVKDVTSSLEVFLQIVAENVNKDNIKVVGIVHHPASTSIFNKINSVITDVFGVNVKYEQIDREAALTTKYNNFITVADAVLVQNLSTDENLRQLLHRVLFSNQFVISEDDLRSSATSPLYRALYVHTIVNADNGQQSLQLARWGAAPAPVATTTVTVRSEADVAALHSARNYMLPEHRLLVLAPYPPPNGLKELVKSWRKEANHNEVHLITVNENSNTYLAVNDLPDINLAFTVLDNENWGGEYYVSVRDSTVAKVSKIVTLKSSRIGELDSLTWVEAPEITGRGITVQVHYAGISHNDVKTASGSLLFKQNIENSYGMDFSGVTNSGQRVMGLIPCGAVSSEVRAHQELLWPVPAHWTLEEAATVPLAYTHAFYCLAIKAQLKPGSTLLVHGGTGAFAQAVIAIALNHGCTVFTTVGNMSKKRFLLKLYPELQADNIGPSRDHSFRDMILDATHGKGCDVVINTLQGYLKNTSFDCVATSGTFIDICQLQNQDDFKYGMYNLTRGRNYVAIDLPSLFNPENIEDVKLINTLISTGTSRGFVRPLSHVTYEPQDVTRAFRLLAASRHRGKVLLRMHKRTVHPQTRLTYNADRCHLILCNDETFGLQLANRLVERGAKKLCIHYKKQSMLYIQSRMRSWKKSGVQVIEFFEDLQEEIDLITLINNATKLGPLEGVYVTASEKQQVSFERLLASLDTVLRKNCSEIKYFAVINIGNNMMGKNVCIKRVQDQLPATFLSLPGLNVDSCDVGASCRGPLDATERALRAVDPVLRACHLPEQQESLLQKIASLAKITLPQNLQKSTTLEMLGVTNDDIPSICYHLRLKYSIAFEKELIPSLSIETIDQLEKTLTKSDFDDIQGLSTFFSYVDTDELLATTEIVILPTLTNDAAMRDDEFDLSQTYLCIVPGMEGHYERFRVLCERLKLHALVLQPGYDRPNETVREMAERYAATLLVKATLQKTFYLLGYESGVAVALQVAAILEEHGRTGTVFCIGYSPEEFRVVLEEQLSGLETMEQLQDAVMRHMFTLMTGDDTTGLNEALQGVSSWSQKIEVCVRTLLGRVPHSAQFAGMLIKIALARIVNARSYVAPVRKLRSQLVLLRPASPTAVEAPLLLQHHSQLPVAVHQLRAPLALATSDLRCGAIINSYLDKATLDAYNKKNTCETYLLNGNTFIKSNMNE